MSKRLWFVGVGLLGLVAGCAQNTAGVAPAFTQDPATVFINELHYDNTGADAGEAVEIAGPAGTALTGWRVVLYNGNGGTVYDTETLSGTLPDQGNGYGTLSVPVVGIQNGAPDAAALVNGAGQTVQLLSYEGTLTAVGGPAGSLASTDIGVAEVGTEAVGFSLQLKGDGATYQDFTWAASSAGSFGAVNAGQTFGEPTEPPPVACAAAPAVTKISAIQGGGATATCVGQSVVVEGVVTGDFAELNGLYVQEEPGDTDADAATSEGVFVFLGTEYAGGAAAVGSQVRVAGTVGEFASGGSSQTQLTTATVTALGDVADVLPTDVTFPLATADTLEAFEGMLVRFPQELAIGESFQYDRFGELLLESTGGLAELGGQGRFYTPTSVVEPGAAASALAASYDLRQITLDDGASTQNPPLLRHPNGEPFSLTNRFRGGDLVTDTVGVIDQTFGLYRVQPTAPAAYAAQNPRPAAPESVGGRFQVGAFNTLNYFLTIDETASSSSGPCGASQTLDCRGADDQNEFNRQRAKLLEAIQGLDTEVLGLIELENTPGVEPLADLVNGLNAELGAGSYAYIDTGVIGTDAIKVGLIYQPAVVAPVGAFSTLDSADDPRFIDTRNRPALAQTFEETATGARFTVAVNHFKSKGSDCGGAPDDDPQQGNCNGTRTQAAAALTDWLQADPTGSGDPDVLVVGDLNAYALEDPIGTLEVGADDAAGTPDDFTNLIETYGGRFAYSYTFDGQLGYLDYALANTALTPQVAGATEWHINADEPDVLDYDTSFKPLEQEALFEPNAYRTADHDPVVIGLELTAPAPLADTYLIDFEAAPTNRIIYSVRLGGGVVHTGGPSPKSSTVPVVGKRRAGGGTIAQAQLAKVVNVYGSDRLIVSSPNSNTPAPTGGRVKLTFTNFDAAGVTLGSVTLSNLTRAGAYLIFYYADGTSSRQTLATTPPGGSLVVPLSAAGVRALDVFAPNAYAVDDVSFTDEPGN